MYCVGFLSYGTRARAAWPPSRENTVPVQLFRQAGGIFDRGTVRNGTGPLVACSVPKSMAKDANDHRQRYSSFGRFTGTGLRYERIGRDDPPHMVDHSVHDIQNYGGRTKLLRTVYGTEYSTLKIGQKMVRNPFESPPQNAQQYPRHWTRALVQIPYIAQQRPYEPELLFSCLLVRFQ